MKIGLLNAHEVPLQHSWTSFLGFQMRASAKTEFGKHFTLCSGCWKRREEALRTEWFDPVRTETTAQARSLPQSV